ncbi:PEP-CTERM sorting domain-containing protein [Pseudoduganella sp. GCM10020061]|uniref:PEP-CTERM sorting domain-containing protein n=1 Tax=Pseudoduganella sp. GCM10020061 TaxID=3317345 RepID=UPI0036424B75
MTSSIKRALTMCAIAAASLGASSLAHAQLTYQGVTFTPSFSGNVLTIEIDAANPTGDWSDATGIIALQVKEVGTWTSVTFSGPGAASGWTVLPNELNANGCDGGSSGIQRACAIGAEVPLTDNMIFTYTFTGGTQDFSNPHIKLIFVDAEGEKTGSLLSMNVPAIPEPSTYAMLLGGLGLLAGARRFASKAA